jgi:hypothetical protein
MAKEKELRTKGGKGKGQRRQGPRIKEARTKEARAKDKGGKDKGRVASSVPDELSRYNESDLFTC